MAHHRWGAALLLSGASLAFALVIAPSSSGRATASKAQALTPIEHVVIILKENRSFDQYFGQLPNVNGASTGQMHDGTIVDLTPTPDPMPADIGHSTNDWTLAYNGGLMNGFDLQTNGVFNGEPIAYTSMIQSQIPNYWAYALRYGLADNMFADFKGASFGNNLFSVAAQSGRFDENSGGGAAISNPHTYSQPNLRRWGCDDPPDTLVTLLFESGQKGTGYPCFNFRALPNILSENGVSWKFYAGVKTARHVALDGISHVRYDPTLWRNIVPFTEFTGDALSGNLPQVSWVLGENLDHPPATSYAGENEAVEIINSVMQGPDWPSTAIFMLWDEWGGFYDHVAPPQVDNISYGSRVPLVVISPFVKYGVQSDGGYVSHTFYSHASYLKFVEDNWGLPSLNERDAGANNVMDMFDFSQVPKAALILTTRSCSRPTPEQARAAEAAAADPY
jgi:phospholipase C